MSGWRSNVLLPDGLIYDGVSEEPRQLYGETGAQSSIVAALDAALGVEHECGWLRDYLAQMRLHSPPAHRRFVERLEAVNAAAVAVRGGSSKTVRGAARDARIGSQLRGAYNDVVAELEAFRGQHRAFAAAYIAAFSKKEGGEMGTGGSDFMPALSAYRKTTAQHKV